MKVVERRCAVGDVGDPIANPVGCHATSHQARMGGIVFHQ